MKISIKHFILAFPTIFFIAMWFPIKLQPLKGVTNPTEKIEFSLINWWNGSFQTAKEADVANNYGGREFAVRLFNQYDYSFYKNIHAKGVVLGRNNILFGKEYIETYFGLSFEKDKPLVDTCINASVRLQNYLKAQNKQLLIVIAPGKATFFSEYIPSNYRYPPTKNNTYDYALSKLKQTNLNYIDMSAYFQTQKGKLPYPLFTEYGVHWSSYGAAIAFDSVSRYIGMQYKLALPKLSIPTVRNTNESGNDADCDLLDLMNLLLPPKLNKARAIPNIKWNETPKAKLNILFVTDSFMWTWVSQNLPQNTFEHYYFWFYNSESWDEKGGFSKVADLNQAEILKKTDLVVLLNNDGQCNNIGCGFAQSVLKTPK